MAALQQSLIVEAQGILQRGEACGLHEALAVTVNCRDSALQNALRSTSCAQTCDYLKRERERLVQTHLEVATELDAMPLVGGRQQGELPAAFVAATAATAARERRRGSKLATRELSKVAVLFARGCVA